MFQTLKNVRRRVVETALETVGASEITVDQEFDALAIKFEVVIQELNQTSSSAYTLLRAQKELISNSKELSQVVQRVYQSNYQDAAWPQTQSGYVLKCTEAAERYKQSWAMLNDCILPCVNHVCTADSYESLKDASIHMSNAVEEEKRIRRDHLKDFDSYRRRLKALEQKRDANEAQGKGSTPAHADTLAEIQRFEAKVQTASETYHSANAKAKYDILHSKEKHDELVDNSFITMVTAQAELFGRAHEEMQNILQLLPQEQVLEARKRILQLVANGGPLPSEQSPVKASKFGSIFPANRGSGSATEAAATPMKASGGAPPSPVRAPAPPSVSLPSPVAAHIPPPPPFVPAAANHNHGVRTSNSHAVAIPVDHAPPPPPMASVVEIGPKVEYAIALFDNEVDDEEELSFTQGTRIEILEKDDSGWYKGRCNGRVGLFPVNYVKLE